MIEMKKNLPVQTRQGVGGLISHAAQNALKSLEIISAAAKLKLLAEEIDVAAASMLRQRLATAGNPLLKSPVTMTPVG